MELRALDSAEDEDYDAVGYDLLLDGKEAEFDGLVQVTLPNDPSWGEDVFVQYQDPKTGGWEILCAQPNGDGTVTFSTDHFCTFAVFKSKVEKGGGSADGELFTLVPGADEKLVTVQVNWDVLAAQVREGKLATEAGLAALTSQGNAYFGDRVFTGWGNVNTGLDFAAKLAKMPGLSDKGLGPLGQAITLGKFLYQCHKYGWSKAFQGNWKDLTYLVVGAGAAAPPPVGPVCLAVTAGYYLYSMTDAIATDIGNSGYDSVAEYAYRDFTMKYLIYNRKTGLVGARYVKDAEEDAATPYQQGYHPLPSGAAAADTGQRFNVFEDAMAREKAGQMKANKYVENVINQVATAFWRLSPNLKNKYLENTPTSGLIAPPAGRQAQGRLQGAHPGRSGPVHQELQKRPVCLAQALL